MELTPLYLKGLLSGLSHFGLPKIQFGATNTILNFLVATLKTNVKEVQAILIMVLYSNPTYPKILSFRHAISTQIIKYFTFFVTSQFGLVTFQELNSHMWPVVTILNSLS